MKTTFDDVLYDTPHKPNPLNISAIKFMHIISQRPISLHLNVFFDLVSCEMQPKTRKRTLPICYLTENPAISININLFFIWLFLTLPSILIPWWYSEFPRFAFITRSKRNKERRNNVSTLSTKEETITTKSQK